MKNPRTFSCARISDRVSSTVLFALLSVTIIFAFCCLEGCGDSSVSSRSEPPVLTNIPDQTITEGELFATVSLDDYVDDPDDTDAEITWTFSGSGSLVVSVNEARVATINLPSLEWNGCDTVVFRASDPSGNSVSEPVVFTVTGINDAPIVQSIPHQIIYESFSFNPIPLEDYVLDYDNTDDEITWTFTGNVDLVVSIVSYRLAIIAIPYSGWTGLETITFRATDPAGLSNECSVLFKVNPVTHDPLVLEDWPVSTPEEQGLDYNLVHSTYLEAIRVDHLYSLLIVKNGYLVAERYFNGSSVSFISTLASATKSYTSALAGLALREGYLTSLDQKMVDFFPEHNWSSTDPRKSDITIRHMLQMRSGYPAEEEYYWNLLFENWDALSEMLLEFPLWFDPGTDRAYSNLTSHITGMVVARASGTDLLSFARTHLFDPLEYGPVSWPMDPQGYYVGWGGLCVRPRDMAKFGLLFLDGGVYKGTQVIPADWVTESLTAYSQIVGGHEVVEGLDNVSYGYLWWGAEVGNHQIHYAAGACGQLIVIVPDLDMVMVTTGEKIDIFDPDARPRFESCMGLIAGFIASQ